VMRRRGHGLSAPGTGAMSAPRMPTLLAALGASAAAAAALTHARGPVRAFIGPAGLPHLGRQPIAAVARAAGCLRGHRIVAAASSAEASDPVQGDLLSAGRHGALGSSRSRRALRKAMQEDPARFDAALAEELVRLQEVREAEGPRSQAFAGAAQDSEEARALQRRIGEVLQGERAQAVAELLHMMAIRGFQRIDVPMVPALEGDLEFREVNLKNLATSLYSEDAVDLVKEHVLSVIGDYDHLSRDFPLRVALLQVAYLYGMSSLFGYGLRGADLRFQLERRLAGAFDVPSDLATSLPGASSRSLREYIAGFGPDEALQATAINSLEAEAVLHKRVSGLFGDLRHLERGLIKVLGPALSLGGEGAAARLCEAIQNGEVTSVSLTVSDMRRLALEGAAFGFLVRDAEAQVDSTYELTPSSGEPRTRAAGFLAS